MATLSLGNVADAIQSGNFSSDLATKVTAGTNSIVTSVTNMVAPGDLTKTVGDLTKTAGGALDAAKNALGGNASDLLTKAGGGALDAAKNALGTNPADLLKSKLGDIKIPPADIKLPEITGLAGAIDAAKGVSGSAFGAIAKSFKPFTAGIPQNLTAIDLKNKAEQAVADVASAGAGALDALKKSAGGNPLDAVKSLGGGALDAVTKAGSAATDALNKASSVASSVVSKVTDATSAASGIGNMPGGQSVIAQVKDLAAGTTSGVTNVLASVNAVTKTVSTAALNGLGDAASKAAGGVLDVGKTLTTGAGGLDSLTKAGGGALDAAKNLLTGNPLDKLTKGLEAGKQGLASLASAGLPASAAAALSASLNSLSTSSPFPIKMPTVAIGTVDRGEISAQVGSILGDKKVPAPNFSLFAPSAETQAFIDKDRAWQATYDKLTADWETEKAGLQKIMDDAIAKFKEAKKTLPQGDPEIENLRLDARTKIDARFDAYDKFAAKRDALVASKYS